MSVNPAQLASIRTGLAALADWVDATAAEAPPVTTPPPVPTVDALVALSF